MEKVGHFFEGAEKVLEIWFSSGQQQPSALRSHDLRTIPRSDWDMVMNVVNAEIISFVHNEKIDSYVLSESSMFVSERRLIIKTCGRTALLRALPLALELARNRCDLDIVEDLYYSRKNFLKPDEQPSPHQDFDEEVAFLNSFLGDGSTFCFGDEGNDKWYLYNVSCSNNNTVPADPRGEEQTLEILMSGLDKQVMDIFTKKVSSSAAEATKVSGIACLFDKATISDYLFDPCGYSMNGILSDGAYYTIHITPEPDFSYVSFETNARVKDYNQLASRVVDIFRPSSFTLVQFKQKRPERRFEGKRPADTFDGSMATERNYACKQYRESDTASGSVCYGFYKSAYS